MVMRMIRIPGGSGGVVTLQGFPLFHVEPLVALNAHCALQHRGGRRDRGGDPRVCNAYLHIFTQFYGVNYENELRDTYIV